MHAFLLVAPLLDHGESHALYNLQSLAQSKSTAATQNMATAFVQSRQHMLSQAQPQSQSESSSQSVLIRAHVSAATSTWYQPKIYNELGVDFGDLSIVRTSQTVCMYAGVMDQPIFTSSTTMSLGATQPLSHDIIQPLAALWPSLPALLLAGAVQRLCQMTQPAQQALTQHDAVTLAGWVQVLLTLSTEVGQQQTQTRTRGSKRKSMSSEVQAATASELHGQIATAAQLRACIGECLAALPKADLETATALRQVLLLLTGQVKQKYAAEYMLWGKTVEQLAALCQLETQADLSEHHVAAASTVTASEGVSDDACVLEAEHRQQHTLQELLAEDTVAASEPRWVLCFLTANRAVCLSHVYS